MLTCSRLFIIFDPNSATTWINKNNIIRLALIFCCPRNSWSRSWIWETMVLDDFDDLWMNPSPLTDQQFENKCFRFNFESYLIDNFQLSKKFPDFHRNNIYYIILKHWLREYHKHKRLALRGMKKIRYNRKVW